MKRSFHSGDEVTKLHLFSDRLLKLSFCSPVSFQTTPSDPVEKRVGTVGKIRPHCTAKLVNPKGEVVPRNTPGEIWVKGYLVQKGWVFFYRERCSFG